MGCVYRGEQEGRGQHDEPWLEARWVCCCLCRMHSATWLRFETGSNLQRKNFGKSTFHTLMTAPSIVTKDFDWHCIAKNFTWRASSPPLPHLAVPVAI